MDMSSSIPIPTQIASLAEDEHRQVRRRIVNFAAVLEEHETEAQQVWVLDLSERGCRLRGEAAIAKGTSLLIKLPGAEAVRATVVWSSEGEAGCAFDDDLHAATVEQVIASATPKRRIVRFGQAAFGRQAT